MTMTKEKEKVITTIRNRLEDLDMKIMDLADAAGMPRNFLSMVLGGNGKVPLSAIVPMAKKLGLDVQEFAALVLATHSRDIWELIVSLQGEDSVSDHERNILKHIRLLANGKVVRYTKNCADELEQFVNAALKR
jgi:plasmid maintenance system antidote protein VapI